MPEELAGVAIVALIIGLIEGLKRVMSLDQRLAPAVAVLAGLVVSLAMTATSGEPVTPRLWLEAVLVGLAWGLSAVGLYSGGRATVAAIKG